MMLEDILILKLGGSLLTDKSTPYTLREELIENIASEIRECIDLGLIKGLVLVHGVGSFGHPPVLKYNLHKGFRNKDQLISLSKTQQIVNELRNTVVAKLIEEEIPVSLMYASSMVVGNKMAIVDDIFKSLKGFLSIGMVPLIGGDMMYDKSMGFSVCGGDQIAVVLSRVLNAKQLLFATDVPGVFDKDPKSGEKAQLLKEVNIKEIEQILNEMNKSAETDASGKMQGKLLSLTPIKDRIKMGLEVAIFSMAEKGTLTKYLRGEEIKTTKIIYK